MFPLHFFSGQNMQQDGRYGDPNHPDNVAVDMLAHAMKLKLAAKREQGYANWDKTECKNEFLSALLRNHVEKGDPVDVANFCAFLYMRSESIAKV